MKLEQLLKENRLDLKKAGNYIGTNYPEWILVLSRCRDSNIFEESNFESALALLGGEKAGDVQVIRAGHWGVGWVEYLAVHESNKKGLKKALEILNGLEEYALVDEDDFYEREREQIERDIESYGPEFLQNALKAFESATDVPSDILNETIGQSAAFKTLIAAMYQEDCGYRGQEDAFVSENTAVRSFMSMHKENWANSDLDHVCKELTKALGHEFSYCRAPKTWSAK